MEETGNREGGSRKVNVTLTSPVQGWWSLAQEGVLGSWEVEFGEG